MFDYLLILYGIGAVITLVVMLGLDEMQEGEVVIMMMVLWPIIAPLLLFDFFWTTITKIKNL